MNVISLLTPKTNVAWLYEDWTIRQGLEKLRFHGYTAIPVLAKDGSYVGTVSEGDFLWRLLSEEEGRRCTMKELEKLRVRDILQDGAYPPVRITVTMDELLDSAMNQNFIPVVDDVGSFIGIVTRKAIMQYCIDHYMTQELDNVVNS